MVELTDDDADVSGGADGVLGVLVVDGLGLAEAGVDGAEGVEGGLAGARETGRAACAAATWVRVVSRRPPRPRPFGRPLGRGSNSLLSPGAEEGV